MRAPQAQNLRARTVGPVALLFLFSTAGCIGSLSTAGPAGSTAAASDVPDVVPAGKGRAPDCPGKSPQCRTEERWVPHVLLAMSDSAINPYHEVYHRPERVEHPCTYIRDYPCQVPALSLSVGMFEDLEAAIEADRDAWQTVEPDTWYWIPRTNLVAVICAGLEGYSEVSIPPRTPDPDRPCLMESHFPVGGESHGTETSSSIVLENPDVSLVFSRGTAYIGHIAASPFPVDLYSQSLAAFGDGEGTLALADCKAFVEGYYHDTSKIFVGGAGNAPNPTILDCFAGDPNIISVGGAYGEPRSQELLAALVPDVVSYYCRPVAKWDTIHEYKNGCGTSIAAPTVAGALSRVILELRRTSGYTGGAEGSTLDPTLGITMFDVRAALNLTATYAPHVNHSPEACPFIPVCPNQAPLLDPAPWIQWSWGFYDSTVVNATLAHLLRTAFATHPDEAVLWMEAHHDTKRRLWER